MTIFAFHQLSQLSCCPRLQRIEANDNKHSLNTVSKLLWTPSKWLCSFCSSLCMTVGKGCWYMATILHKSWNCRTLMENDASYQDIYALQSRMQVSCLKPIMWCPRVGHLPSQIFPFKAWRNLLMSSHDQQSGSSRGPAPSASASDQQFSGSKPPSLPKLNRMSISEQNPDLLAGNDTDQTKRRRVQETPTATSVAQLNEKYLYPKQKVSSFSISVLWDTVTLTYDNVSSMSSHSLQQAIYQKSLPCSRM